MSYTILESRIEFAENTVKRLTVLVDCTSSSSSPYSDVRAIFATTTPISGYMFIMPNTPLSEDLLQKVAAAGMETTDRDKIFIGWKVKHNAKKNNSH